MTNVTGIVFDLDNTLWDCDPVIMRAEQKFYQWLLIKHQLRKEWMYQVAFDVGSLHKNKSNFDSEFIEEGFNVFWQERNNVVFYEGALDMLERLSKRYSLGKLIPWPGGKYPSGVIRKHSELEDKICQL